METNLGVENEENDSNVLNAPPVIEYSENSNDSLENFNLRLSKAKKINCIDSDESDDEQQIKGGSNSGDEHKDSTETAHRGPTKEKHSRIIYSESDDDKPSDGPADSRTNSPDLIQNNEHDQETIVEDKGEKTRIGSEDENFNEGNLQQADCTKKISLKDSDDSDDKQALHGQNNSTETARTSPTKGKHSRIIYSDSDDDRQADSDSDSRGNAPDSIQNHVDNVEIIVQENGGKRTIDREEDNFNEALNGHLQQPDCTNNEDTNIIHPSEPKNVSQRLKALYDSESSEDETRRECSSGPLEVAEVSNSTKKRYRPPKATRGEITKPMTAKQAQQQRQEIYSESQRMLRETRVSLPYHKAKTRSIREFLQQRPRLSAALLATTTATPPSVAIKMCGQQLDVITQKLDQRKKEMEKFYQSESESSQEEDNVETDENQREEMREEVTHEPTLEVKENVDEATHIEEDEKNGEETANLIAVETEKNHPNEETDPDDALAATASETIEAHARTVEAHAHTVEAHTHTPDDSVKSIEYDFNLDDLEDEAEQRQQEKEEAATIRSKAIDLVKAQLGNVKPRLSGGPDQEIDLDEGVFKPSGVAQLMERFMQHNARKSVGARDKVALNVTNFAQGEIHKEVVAISVEPEEERVDTEKPGVKLKKLKDELHTQMAQRRSEMWQHKAEEMKQDAQQDENDDKIPSCEADAILDDDEEEEFTDIEEEDDEAYEDYLKRTEKSNVKSKFIDDEAEDTDADVEDNMDEDDASDDCDQEEESTKDEENDAPPTCDETKKLRKRILQPFSEDSDDDCVPDPTQDVSTVLELTDTCNDDDDNIPPNQPVLSTPSKDTADSRSNFGFLTPVIHLTALQNANSGSKPSPVSPFLSLTAPSPLKQSLQKKLFADDSQQQPICEEANNSQSCGKSDPSPSPPPQNTPNPIHYFVEAVQPQAVATQDLLSVVSGRFTSDDGDNETPTVAGDAEHATAPTQRHLHVGDSAEIKNLDEDGLIAELLNEEAMAEFRKRFEPVAAAEGEGEEVLGGGRLLSDSEEEEGDEGEVKLLKKPKGRVVLSDDESDDSDEAEIDDQEIDLHDNLSSAEDEDVNAHVEYNSEEEVIGPNQKLKLADFIEKEAELSESEWGSEDEDEKGLDRLEVEQGDAEVFDEEQLRADLEKIHMRRVLDDDNHEVKMLQEMLLEDGELHGTGRQRQFRWRNIDSLDESEVTDKGDVDTFLDDEDCEEKWRIMRYERETFIKNAKQSQNIDDDDLSTNDSNSQFIKLGQEVMKKNVPTMESVEKVRITPTTSFSKQPFDLTNKRGSFLTRNEAVLTRLAEITRTAATEPTVGGATKSSKSFLFQSVEVATKITALPENKNKRKTDGNTPNVLKKLRLSANMSPMGAPSKKKLF